MKCMACYSTVVYMFYRRFPSTITEFFLRVHFKKGEIRAASPCLSVCVCTHTSCFPDSCEYTWGVGNACLFTE